MPTTKDIDHNGIDKTFHPYDMSMNALLQMFQIFMMKCNHFKSFFKIFSIYLVMMIRRFLLFFEEIKHIPKILAIFFKEDQKYNKHDGNNESQ